MYLQWTNITERDLIQKGATYTRVKTSVKLDKLVLNMTLPNVGNSMFLKENRNNSNKNTQGSGQKQDQESSLRESALNLSVMSLLAVVSGQRPILTKARKSIANWKVRKNQVLGFKVTLRGKSVFEFIDKTVRFQIINEQDPLNGLSNVKRSDSDRVLELRPQLNVIGSYSLQTLGNINIGIKTLNFYPELEDFWLAQSLGQKGDLNSATRTQSGSSSFLGLDLSLSFKKSKEVSYLVNFILRQSGGMDKLNGLRGSSLVGQQKAQSDFWCDEARQVDPKLETNLSKLERLNKSLLYFKNILSLRKLYLTSFGLYPRT